jgi:hypothetical protein
MSAEELQNWLIAISLVVTTVVTIILQIKSNKNNQKEFLDKQLIELQRMSFYDPFVEDKNFTKNWLELKTKYENKTICEAEKNQFLKYDVYTEMLFNFLEMSCKIYSKEKDLLNYVDFKSWIRTHSECWKNPIDAHSNRDVYGKKIYNMVDDWLK